MNLLSFLIILSDEVCQNLFWDYNISIFVNKGQGLEIFLWKQLFHISFFFKRVNLIVFIRNNLDWSGIIYFSYPLSVISLSDATSGGRQAAERLSLCHQCAPAVLVLRHCSDFPSRAQHNLIRLFTPERRDTAAEELWSGSESPWQRHVVRDGPPLGLCFYSFISNV